VWWSCRWFTVVHFSWQWKWWENIFSTLRITGARRIRVPWGVSPNASSAVSIIILFWSHHLFDPIPTPFLTVYQRQNPLSSGLISPPFGVSIDRPRELTDLFILLSDIFICPAVMNTLNCPSKCPFILHSAVFHSHSVFSTFFCTPFWALCIFVASVCDLSCMVASPCDCV
jgi:hypothetical protein